jgi:hypothetical protein
VYRHAAAVILPDRISGRDIRYFTYYLATSILDRGNTSNISDYHLAFLATALDVSKKYNLGAFIARRLAARGPIYGGIIAARIVAALGLSIAPNGILLVPERFDFNSILHYKFVSPHACLDNLSFEITFFKKST